MNRNKGRIKVTLRNIDIITAALILTGQVTIHGVFIQAGGEFSVSLTGPITGGYRIEGKPPQQITNMAIDIIDILLAIFLLADQINVTGTFFTTGRFNIIIGGPLFGGQKTEARNVKPCAADFRKYLKMKKGDPYDFIRFTNG